MRRSVLQPPDGLQSRCESSHNDKMLDDRMLEAIATVIFLMINGLHNFQDHLLFQHGSSVLLFKPLELI